MANRCIYLSLVIPDVCPVVAGIDAALVNHDCVKTKLKTSQLLDGVVHLFDGLERKIIPLVLNLIQGNGTERTGI